MDAYNKALKEWTLSGPTKFCPMIKKAMEYAQAAVSENKHQYFILLILTDGVIDDIGLEEAVFLARNTSEIPSQVIYYMGMKKSIQNQRSKK